MKQMKNNALIFTLYGNRNYGNKLQNYATQELLKKYFNVVKTKVEINKLQNIKDLFKKILPIKTEWIRYNNFKKFDNKYINKEYNDITVYDEYIIGSDQVFSL